MPGSSRACPPYLVFCFVFESGVAFGLRSQELTRVSFAAEADRSIAEPCYRAHNPSCLAQSWCWLESRALMTQGRAPPWRRLAWLDFSATAAAIKRPRYLEEAGHEHRYAQRRPCR
jgi:hypothetical protein